MKKEIINLKENKEGYLYRKNWREEKEGGNDVSILLSKKTKGNNF